MTDAISMLAYVLAIVFGVAPALARVEWTSRAPRMGIAAWHVLCVATVIAMIFAGLLLSINLPFVGSTVASVVDLCASTLQHIYEPPDRHTASILALLLLLAIPLRLIYVGWRTYRELGRQSRRLMGLISPVARQVPGCGDALMIDHSERYAFCLPGRGGPLVVTSALVQILTPSQFAAVLAHERAHKQQHHHLALLMPKVLRRTFGRALPIFGLAERQVARLIELCADDAARRVAGDEALAEALVRVTRMPASTPALAASAVAVEERLARLRESDSSGARWRALTYSALVTALALTPLLLTLSAALSSAWSDLCLLA